MRGLARVLLLVLLSSGNINCSTNIFETFANKSGNEALYDSAMADVNSGNYSSALNTISLMTSSYAATTAVLELQASAYGGLCGFQFLPFVQKLQGVSTSLLFPFLLQAFDIANASSIDSCIQAEQVLLSIGSTATLSTNDNFFLAMIEFAKIGNILSYYADPNKTGAGTSGWDPCAVGGARSPGGAMTDSDASQVGVALSLAAASLTAVAGQISTGGTSLSTISSVCSALPGGENFCSVTSASSLTAPEILGVRSLIKENSVIGLGTNCTGDITTCFCP